MWASTEAASTEPMGAGLVRGAKASGSATPRAMDDMVAAEDGGKKQQPWAPAAASSVSESEEGTSCS